jgi:hypothetical protein
VHRQSNGSGNVGQERAEADRLNFACFDDIARLAELAASYWCSTALAADRGEILTIAVHCRQVAAVTREAFALVKSLGQGQEGRDPS